MLTVLSFTILSFLLITAFYLNVTIKYINYRNPLHRPVRIAFCVIYSANLTGFILAGYLILSNEIEVAMDLWRVKFIINLAVLALSTPVIYFSKNIATTTKWSITKVRLFLLMVNIYPLVNVYMFYRH